MHSGMRPHGRVCKIWSSLQFPLAFLSGCYNHWSLGYLRHDAREMKHFSCYVWQVTVQEDKEWLNHSDFMGETGGKGCYKSQKDSNQYSTDPHYKEVSNSSEYINNLNCAHLAERLEQIVQDLWEKEKSTSCFWILFNFLLCYHVPLIQCWTLYFSILNALLRYAAVYFCHLCPPQISGRYTKKGKYNYSHFCKWRQKTAVSQLTSFCRPGA